MLFNIPKEQRRIMIEEIQQFFLNERDEEISSFAAEKVLNFFQSSLAPHFYNNAVNDAIKVLEQQYSSIEEEVRTLERPTIKS